jgi:hypothetical protein
MTFAPTVRDIAEHRQDRQFIIVVPKNERIVPQEQQAEPSNQTTRCDCTKEIRPQMNTDFHRCRETNLRTCVSSVFISGEKLIWLQDHGFSFGHNQYLVFDAVNAR